MPYSNISQLPKQFAGVPKGAKMIAMHVINSMLKAGRKESQAFAGAWSQIKKVFKKVGEAWTKKDSDTFVDAYNEILATTEFTAPGFGDNFELDMDRATKETDIEDAKYVIPVVPMKAMVQEYWDGRALKCYEELEKATVQLDNLPFIDDHPPEGKTWKDMPQLGYVTSPTWNCDLKQAEALLIITADMALGDLPKSVSIGFDAERDWTAGEYDGTKYDYVQRNIKLDHLASVTAGRCEYPECGLNVVDGQNPKADGRTDAEEVNNEKGVKHMADEKDIRTMSLDSLVGENESVRKLREERDSLQKKFSEEKDKADAALRKKLDETEAELKEKSEKLEEAEKKVKETEEAAEVTEKEKVEETSSEIVENTPEEEKKDMAERLKGKDSKELGDILDAMKIAKGEKPTKAPTGDKSVRGATPSEAPDAPPTKFDKMFGKDKDKKDGD